MTDTDTTKATSQDPTAAPAEPATESEATPAPVKTETKSESENGAGKSTEGAEGAAAPAADSKVTGEESVADEPKGKSPASTNKSKKKKKQSNNNNNNENNDSSSNKKKRTGSDANAKARRKRTASRNRITYQVLAPAKDEPKLEVPAGAHKLQTTWSFWYEKKSKSANFEDTLNKLGTFNTVESFFKYYSYLTRVDQLHNHANLYMFRSTHKPMWETFPKGGCWIVKFNRADTDFTARKWEELLLGAIGEQFASPDLVGVTVSVRNKELLLSVYNHINTPGNRFHIGEKLKEVLKLDSNQVIEYKPTASAIADNSSYRNAKKFVVP